MKRKKKFYEKYLKRGFDFVLCLLGIIILSPLYLIIAIAVKVDSPGPVLFKQNRIGIDKSTFNILKFRTMKIDTPKDSPTHMLENPDQWITRVGKFLRRTSLDEIPQIFNIIAGQMAIVGPRPALWNQEDLIEERDKYDANDVRPGLTGLAQVSGRDELEIDVKAKIDGEYVSKIGFIFDLKCIVNTVIVVFKREGVVEGKQEKEEDKEE